MSGPKEREDGLASKDRTHSNPDEVAVAPAFSPDEANRIATG